MNYLKKTLYALFWLMVSYSAFAFMHKGVVVTSHYLASQVGKAILDEGGNAIDAAVAVGYALSVVEPCCGNLGGGGFMLIRLRNKEAVVINFREKAPLATDRKKYFDQKGLPDSDKIRSGYLSVAVPGTVMGLNTALQKYGTMPLKQVISPAIKLARYGFYLNEKDAAIIAENFSERPLPRNIRAIFTKKGHLIRAGESLIQMDLARTLQLIENAGTAAFYRGQITEQIVKDSQTHHGILSKKDFQDYAVEIQQPLFCHYRGYKIVTVPPPSAGGVLLCEILEISSLYPLSSMGYRSTKSLHATLEAMRYAYADRGFLGDPDFVDNPVSFLLSTKHAAFIRHQIQLRSSQSIDDPKAFISHEKSQTTHYSIVDKQGNAVAVTYTLNGNFGAKIIAGRTGIFMNNEMDDFNLKTGIANQFGLIQSDKNAMQAQKRPLSSMTPTIVLKNEQLFMILGAPGGSTIPTQVVETIQNVIDYHLDLKTAINAPRFHMQWQPNLVYFEKGAMSQQTQASLKKMGYHFQLGSPFNTLTWGAVAAILFERETGLIIGVMDKRRPSGLVTESFQSRSVE